MNRIVVKFFLLLNTITMLLPLKLFELELKRNSCYKDYLTYKRVIDKVDKCHERVSFLEKCRDTDLIPKFLNFGQWMLR